MSMFASTTGNGSRDVTNSGNNDNFFSYIDAFNDSNVFSSSISSSGGDVNNGSSRNNNSGVKRSFLI